MSTKRPILFLDPGHDPEHPGNINRGLRECDSTMQICERIAHYVRLLSKEGGINSKHRIDVVMSRQGRECPVIGSRTFRAREIKANLLVSIHTNSVINPLAKGAEAWVSDQGTYRVDSNALAAAMLTLLHQKLGLTNRGVKASSTNRLGGLGIVDQVAWHMPAVLLEPCFASNPTERGLLLDPRWREDVAATLAAIIVGHLGIEPRTDLVR